MTDRVVFVAGYSGRGKTALLVRLVERLKKRGLRVGVLKRSRSRARVEVAGTDTQRLYGAGADAVGFVGPEECFVRRRGPVDLAEAMGMLGEVDLVLVEGGKHLCGVKIWVGPGAEEGSGSLLAVVDGEPPSSDVPVLSHQDVDRLVELITDHLARGQ